MKTYPKIQTVFLRDPATNFKTLLDGHFSTPEFAALADVRWKFTEKVDGTNMRILWNGERVEFRGKTDAAQIHSNLVTWMSRAFSVEKLSTVFGKSSACLYGEGYGAKIQKGGGNYSPDQKVVLFDVLIGGVWLTPESVEDIAAQIGVESVPLIGIGKLSDMVQRARLGFASKWGEFPAEGIVARPACGVLSRTGGRIITKIKHKDFR